MKPEVLQEVALQVANSRTLEQALGAVVSGLSRTGSTALARIWLFGKGDRCSGCSQAPVCETRSRCLHLRASEGISRVDGTRWDRTDGDFARMPLTEARKVGYCALRRLPVLIDNITNDSEWVARPEWIREEGLQSFAAQPLVFREETLGVVGLFSRGPLGDRELGWLRTFADRAAVSIVNARAFDEIAELRRLLEAERDYLRVEVKRAGSFGSIIGDSPALRALLEQVELVAATDAGVLLHGESGTGKELAAVAIHDRSPRKSRALVRVNCASIPRELFESEFFGHVKGSFSGAVRDRAGRFELADGGTLFLDEVGEIPIELQGKLLRVLQEGTFERVGDERTRTVDVRLITATNRDLKEEVAAGRFREDLYYRLSVFPIQLPALRERRGDVSELAQHFLDQACTRMKRDPIRLTIDQVQQLEAHTWPGNIRELQNTIERGVILSQGTRIQLDGLQSGARPRPGRSPERQPGIAPFRTEIEMRQAERDNLLAVLRHARGKVSGPDGAAELLGVRPTTLASRIKKLAITDQEIGAART